MIALLGKLSSGHVRRHRLEALLCLAGVALGVAVVVAIDAAVQACVGSFQGAVSSLAERSTHSIFSQNGPLTDETYIELLRQHLPFPMAPVIDRGALVSANGRSAVGRLIGVDVFSERSFRSFTQMQSSLDKAAFERFLTTPGQLVLADDLAGRLGVKPGDRLQITAGSRRADAQVAGVVSPAGVARAQLTDLLVADLATAQEMSGALGCIDRIDVHLDSASQQEKLAAALPPNLVLRSTSQQSASLGELIKSYQLNLNALSLMASFVAIFIVYNSMLISVQQRLTTLGILRCLGASRTQLAGLYILEAMVLAAAGGLIGVLGGWGLARVLVGFIATTINDLYASIRPGPVQLGWAELAKGFGISAASCLVGAMAPLYRASRTPPVNAFRETVSAKRSAGATLPLLAGGAALLAGAYGIYLLPISSPVPGFVMAVLVALGFALACPALTRAACALLGSVAAPLQLLPLRMAASGVARSLGITGVAVAATMLAMSMNIGVRTMVSSFHGALDRWMGQRFSADVFVGPELLVNHKIDATLDPRVEQWVRRQPQVRRVLPYRITSVPFGGAQTMLVATDVEGLLSGTFPLKKAAPTPFDPRAEVLISEPLAGRAHLRMGDRVALPSPTGSHEFLVHAVFFDFGNEHGQIIMDHATYAADWHDGAVTSLHIRVAPGVVPEQLAAEWSGALRPDFPVVVNSFSGVRTEVLAVFDRTFKVTSVLSWLAGAVAFCGLAGSLLALALARQRDYSVLAAVGMSGRQTAAWVLGQGLLIAWTSALVACVAGTVLAYVLSYVIQYRSFGWSIPTSPQPRFWLEGAVIATAAAIVATIYPAWRLLATPPAGSLRQE